METEERSMLKNMFPIITNNLIAIVIHIFMGILIFIPIAVLLAAPFLFLAAVIPHTLFVCGLYFLAGRLFLRSTKNKITDFISVIGLVITIITMTFLTYATGLRSWSSWLMLSFFAPGFVLSEGSRYGPYLIPADEKLFIFMILSLLAPLAMWAGLRAKQYVSTLEIQQHTSLKNRLLLILSKKKQSFILFIALICLPFFSIVFLAILLLIILIVTYEIEVLLGWR